MAPYSLGSANIQNWSRLLILLIYLFYFTLLQKSMHGDLGWLPIGSCPGVQVFTEKKEIRIVSAKSEDSFPCWMTVSCARAGGYVHLAASLFPCGHFNQSN